MLLQSIFSIVQCLGFASTLLLVATIVPSTNAWVTPSLVRPVQPCTMDTKPVPIRRSTTVLLAAAAGGGGFGGSGGATKEVKLKPKQQWDRYTALKKETPVKVAVRVTDDDKGDWLPVGCVKSSTETVSTPVAVARQRALLAEHAKRLYPLLVSAKATIEWAYGTTTNTDDTDSIVWTAVDKSILDEAPTGIEKLVGFEGTPDPASGFYCVYNEGRLVKNTDGDIGLKPSSKKLG